MNTKNTLKFLKLCTFFLLIISFSGCGQDQIAYDDSDGLNNKGEQKGSEINNIQGSDDAAGDNGQKGKKEDTGTDGTNETGTNETGTDETGTNETGTNETGTNETGTDETGTDETGTNETGTDGSDVSSPILPMALFMLVFLALVFVILKYMSNLSQSTNNSDEVKPSTGGSFIKKVKAFFKKDGDENNQEIEPSDEKLDENDKVKNDDSFKINEDNEFENVEDNDSESVNENINENKSSDTPDDNNLDKALKNIVLQQVSKWFKALNKKIVTYSEKSLESQKKIESLSNELIRTIADLNSTIDFQQKEIERYKQGYDYKIRKDSFIALVELNDTVKNLLNESDTNEQTTNKLGAIIKNIDSYLDEMDIESFYISPGKSWREIDSNMAEKNIVSTKDPDMHEKVEKTVKCGYIHKHDDGQNIIRPAVVNIYKFIKEEQDE